MNDIMRVLRTAAWRLLALDLVRTFLVTMSAGVSGLIVLRIVEKVFGLGLTGEQWWTAGAIAAGAAAAGAVAWSLVIRHNRLGVARALDERADLRESLSTALWVARSEDPWARAVVETARDRASRVDVRRAIPLEAPRFWPTPLALGLVLAIVWWTFPNLDVLGLLEKRVVQEQQQREIQEVKAEVRASEQKLEELLKKANVELKPEESAGADPMDQSPQSPEEIRRAAVKRLTSMQERLNEMQGGEKAQRLEALRQAMKQLKQPGPGPLENLSKALSQGNFQKAQEHLDELAKKLGDGSLSEQEKEQLKKQLEKLSEQLQKLSEDRSQMEKALEKAGLDKEQAKKLAMDPEALRKALEAMENLSEEQKQQLMEAAKKMASANSQCQGMGQAMGEMARGMGKTGMSQEGMEGMEGLAGQLSDLEMMAAEMDTLDAAMSECRSMLARLGQGMCEGGGEGMGMELVRPWSPGESRSRGMGQGGPGMGEGGAANAEEAPTSTEKAMAQSKMQQGPIVGSRLVYGEQVRGESQAEFSEAVSVGARSATEVIDEMLIPREYHDAVKAYFGRLQSKVQPAPPAPGGP